MFKLPEMNLNNSLSKNSLLNLGSSIQSFNHYKFYNTRNYSTSCKTYKLKSWWVTGFADGDSAFMLKLKKRTNFSWQILPVFQIGLNIKDKDIIEKIKSYFNDKGIISFDYKNNKVYFTINKIKDLNDYIIPHFESYPLQSEKFVDYKLWSECVKIMIVKDHLKESGLFRILSLKTALNKGISQKLKEEFPNIVVLKRPELNYSTDLLDNNWIAGFSAAESSFSITISEKQDRKLSQVRARFSIGLNHRDEHLLIKIKNQFNAGNLYSVNTALISNYEVGNLQEIKEKFIPFFDLYPLNNIKSQDFLDFKKVINLINNKEHLTESRLLLIKEIKNNMNLRRK